MATLTGPTKLQHLLTAGEIYLAVWSNLLMDESGDPVQLSEFADRSVQVAGTFGGTGTDRLVIELSNQMTPVDWFIATGSAGTRLSLNSTILSVDFGTIILEPSIWIRPRMSGGGGSTDLTIYAYLRRSRQGNG